MAIDIEPKKIAYLKVKFNSSLENQGESVINGAAQIYASGFTQIKSVSLIGFMGEARLELKDCESSKVNYNNSKLEKQLKFRGLRKNIFNIKLTKNTNAPSYHKTTTIRNHSSSSRCLVFLVLLDSRKGIEISARFKNNELIADLNEEAIIKLNTKSLHQNEDLAWIEMEPGEERSLSLNVDTKLKESKFDLNSITVSLFWLESEIYSYCNQGAQMKPYNEPVTSNLIFIDSFLNKLINKRIISKSVLYKHRPFNDSLLKERISGEDLTRLLRLATRCAILNLQSEKVTNIEYSFNSSMIFTPLISALIPDNKSEQSTIKLNSLNNHIHIQCPAVYITQTKEYELVLMNTNENVVNWKVYSTNPAMIKMDKSLMSEVNNFESSIIKFDLGVFKLTPSFGVITPGNKETIKVEFNPCENFGIFSQLYQIDTRTDLKEFYGRKLVLSGRSIPLDSYEKETEEDHRLNSRVFKSKTNCVFNGSDESQNSNYVKTATKENLMLRKSNIINSVASKKNISIKEEFLNFADTEPGKISKNYLIINNREDKALDLNIYRILEPFHCKYAGTTVNINSRHYVKVPVMFKPQMLGDYFDKIIIRVNNNETLTCNLKARCVHSI